MKRGVGRTILIVMIVSFVAALIIFTTFFYMFDMNKMLSSDGNQTTPSGTNDSSSYSLDDSGFVTWVKKTNDTIAAQTTSIRNAAQAYDMQNLSKSCIQTETLINSSLAELKSFNLSESFQNLSDQYQQALVAFWNGAHHGELAANGSGMQDIRLTMTYFIQGSTIASQVIQELDNSTKGS